MSTVALVLCALVGLSAAATAQSHNASDRARLAGEARGLFTDLGEVRNGRAIGLQEANGRGLSLNAAQNRALGVATRHARLKGARIVRLPEKLAAAEAFAFGYSSARGLAAAERPNGGGRLLAVRDELTDLSEGAYGWTGRLYVADDPRHALGTISLVYRQGVGVSGDIQVRTDLYLVEPLGNGLHVLIDAAEDEFKDGPGTPTSSGGRPAGDDGEAERFEAVVLNEYEASPLVTTEEVETSTSNAPVAAEAQSSTTARVLVLYTAGAANGVTSIDNVIDQSILNSNTAYSRSELYSPRLQLAHKQLLSGFSEGTLGTANDLQRLRQNSTARSLRDQYKADVVVLLTTPEYYDFCDPYGCYEVGGEAIKIQTPGVTTAEDAYVIVDASRAISRKVFTHEVGHIQGARHHPDDDQAACNGTGCPDIGYSYGRGHRERWAKCFGGAGWICGYNRHATVMAYTLGGSYPNIWNISNPDVDDPDTGARTGIENERDNARVLQNTATTISAYRQNPLTASISGPSLLTPNESGTWYANAAGGSGTTTYRWYRNGAFTGVTSSSYSTTAGYTDFSLRVDIVRGPESASANRYVTVFDNGGCDPDIILCPGEDPGGPLLVAAPEAFALRSVGPNPFESSTVIAYDVPEASSVAIAVYDLLGREVARVVDGEVGAGTHQVQFDGSALSPGVYVVRMQADTFADTHEITVVR